MIMEKTQQTYQAHSEPAEQINLGAPIDRGGAQETSADPSRMLAEVTAQRDAARRLVRACQEELEQTRMHLDVERSIAEKCSQVVSDILHRVRRYERPSIIAAKHGISVEQLVDANPDKPTMSASPAGGVTFQSLSMHEMLNLPPRSGPPLFIHLLEAAERMEDAISVYGQVHNSDRKEEAFGTMWDSLVAFRKSRKAMVRGER